MSSWAAPGSLRARALGEALRHADYLRRSPAALGGLGGHKEWLHFCVYAPGVDVLANFSLCDDVREAAPKGAELARISALVRDDRWDGDVDLWPSNEVVAPGGRVHLAFGPNEVELRDGVYHLRLALRERPIEMDLRLRPVTMPSLANNIELDPGPPINWLVVPRLLADGTVRVGERTHRFTAAPAYHDHNWGHFAWGRDFAWEWGFGLPARAADPWSMVFVRLSDRAHTRALMQALFLWKGARQHRVLRASDVRVEHEGHLRPERVFKLPRPMALLAPDLLPDVPAVLRVRAAGDGDALECVFTAEDGAQVILPNDHDLGVTIINEVSGAVRLEGRVRGEDVFMEGRAIFEFLGA